MASVELETVQWDRVDCVFEEGDNSVPHYNYRIQSRDALGSANLEVFVEEEQEVTEGVKGRLSITSPPPVYEEPEEEGVDARTSFGGSSAGSTSSGTGLKYDYSQRKYSMLK